MHLAQDLHPPFTGMVGTPIDRFSVRQGDHIQGPPPRTGHKLDGRHVHLVNVRAFFTVYFDIDEVLIHKYGYGVILKGLLFHDMAPVTGGISNAYEHQLAFFCRTIPDILLPGLPVHRVPGVLQQIRTGFLSQTVASGPGILPAACHEAHQSQ
ncbi:MAG: hypothetical protein P8X60_09965 [Robiginitalea sp.]